MCRVDVAGPAALALARLLADLRDALCAADGSDPDDVRIGPVDFGLLAVTPYPARDSGPLTPQPDA